MGPELMVAAIYDEFESYCDRRVGHTPPPGRFRELEEDRWLICGHGFQAK
jgi:hypothetical protein